MIIDYYVKEESEDGITFKKIKFEDMTITGRKIEDAIELLMCIDLEREIGMKMCLENLQKFKDRIEEDFKKTIQKAQILANTMGQNLEEEGK